MIRISLCWFLLPLVAFGQIQKPPAGSQINWSHPLSAGLVSLVPLCEGSGTNYYDAATKKTYPALTLAGTPTNAQPPTWLTPPVTADYPWVGPAISNNGATAKAIQSTITTQFIPTTSTGYSYAVLMELFSSSALGRLMDGTGAAVITMYQNIPTHIGDVSTTWRNASNTAVLPLYAYTVNKWILVLCTVQNGLGVMYVNGVEVARDTTVNLTKSVANQTGKICYNTTGNGSMMCDANFSSWWVWNNRVLTAQEAAQMYADPWAMFRPTVTTNPVSQTGTSGNTVNFTAASAGNPVPTVQWQVSAMGTTGTFSNINSVANPSATTGTLTLSNLTPSQNGYAYQAVFTNTSGSCTTTPATLTVQPTFAWFQNQQGLTNPDPTADPNHTGVCQLAAYAFGVNPLAPDRSQLPQVGLQNGYLQISYPKWINAADLTYVVEVSGDLQTWDSGPSFTQQVSVIPIDATREQVVEEDLIPTTSAPRGFMRVRITH